ncbi:MAG: hypothetical protein HKP48_09135 [Winogradskyella sp.]|uniref:hypothetical protein n=1 Tax=Winogradskyella sp. TaxID=1883156 RepID=UPI00179DB64E|nr:hypothetical protein [Winogradskyella sp.]MBT8244150.1 hypothetical protein [Winogradskyella sp.]NNK23435.1 hypothetical protein [Winogradskyella sp.]
MTSSHKIVIINEASLEVLNLKANKSYLVIDMLDAQNIFNDETSYVGEWKVDEFLDGLTNN